MFLRDAPTQTLIDVRDSLDDGSQTIQKAAPAMRVDLEQNVLSFTESEITIPMTTEGVTALGNWLDVPSKFLLRMEADMQQDILNRLLQRTPATGNLVYNDQGLKVVRDPNSKFIEPRRLVDKAIKVVAPEAWALDFWSTTDEFRLDVTVPEDFDRGVGGDRQVNDITTGGIRMGMDIKHGLSPWVQPLLYRLACTNGMETTDPGLKIDARGATVEEVLAEFELIAERAFSRVEQQMEDFYRLRAERVANPERTLIRLAEERGLPARTVMQLAERVPAHTDEHGAATMFDLVNMVTNAANDPRIRNRAGARRTLEQTGGSIVAEHAERCGHCSSKLS